MIRGVRAPSDGSTSNVIQCAPPSSERAIDGCGPGAASAR